MLTANTAQIETRTVEATGKVKLALVAAFAVLMLALAHGNTVREIGSVWANDPDLGHGPVAALLSLMILWDRRNEIAATPVQPLTWPLSLVAFSVLLAVLGIILDWPFLRFTSLIILVFSGTLAVFGIELWKKLLMPMACLAFAVPPPAGVYESITRGMQYMASVLAEHALDIAGISFIREGSLIMLPHVHLSIVEACSGVRSLFTLSFLAFAYGQFMEPSRFGQLLIFAAAAPITILANAGRIVLIALNEKGDGYWTSGTWHNMIGWAMLGFSFLAIVLLHRTAKLIGGAVRQ